MVTKEQARQLVSAQVCERPDWLPPEDELIIVDESTIERAWGWVFFHTSKRWLETQDIRYALTGNSPIIVERESGRLINTGTAMSIEHYIANYERCGNPNANPLPIVTMTGWRKGARTVSAIQAVRRHSSHGLAAAKLLVEECLGSHKVQVETTDVAAACALVESLTESGFIAEINYGG